MIRTMSIQQLASSFIRISFLATSIFVSSFSIGQEIKEAMAIDSQLEVSSCSIKAAQQTDSIEKEPKPFVLHTSLDDFYVSYQINAYTNIPDVFSKEELKKCRLITGQKEMEVK